MTSIPCFGQPTKFHWSLWGVSEKTLPGRCHASVACTGQGPPADEMSNHATRLVNRRPPVTRYALSSWARHPVPIAFGEMSKLCVVDESARVTHPESICFPFGRANPGLSPADKARLTADRDAPAGAIRLTDESLPVLDITAIRYPAFEFLRPSVVIRRRPQRMHPPGSAC